MKALAYAADRDQIALFMEMRLGKTMVARRWADKRVGRKLVLAPLTVLLAWYDELKEEGIAPEDIKLLNSSKRRVQYKPGKHDWVLLNFEGFRGFPGILEVGFDSVIVDESTRIKNPQAKVTKMLTNEWIERLPERRAILSGMPNPESDMNYFSQFVFLEGHFMGFDNFWKWRDKFFYQPSYNSWDWIPRKDTQAKIKAYVQARAFVMTRKEAGLDKEKIYSRRYVEMNPRQKQLYDQVYKEYSYGSSQEEETKWATVKETWLARIAGGFGPTGEEEVSNAKASEIADLLQEELRGQHVVVWCRFEAEIQFVAEYLREALHEVETITGADTPDERYQKIGRWRRSGQVLITNVACCRYSLDFSVASTSIYYSNVYELEGRTQSEDRILNVSKEGSLLLIDLVTKDTVDEDIVEGIRTKKLSATYLHRRVLDSAKLRSELKSGRTP